MRQGCHNYERPACGTGSERGTAATNGGEEQRGGWRADRGGGGGEARSARIVGGVIE